MTVPFQVLMMRRESYQSKRRGYVEMPLLVVRDWEVGGLVNTLDYQLSELDREHYLSAPEELVNKLVHVRVKEIRVGFASRLLLVGQIVKVIR